MQRGLSSVKDNMDVLATITSACLLPILDMSMYVVEALQKVVHN